MPKTSVPAPPIPTTTVPSRETGPSAIVWSGVSTGAPLTIRTQKSTIAAT